MFIVSVRNILKLQRVGLPANRPVAILQKVLRARRIQLLLVRKVDVYLFANNATAVTYIRIGLAGLAIGAFRGAT